MGAGGGGDGGGGPAIIGSARRGDRVVQTGQDARVTFHRGTNERTGIARHGSNPPEGGTRIARAMGTSSADRLSNQRMADAFFTGRPMPGETYTVDAGPGGSIQGKSVSTSDPYNIGSGDIPPPPKPKPKPKPESKPAAKPQPSFEPRPEPRPQPQPQPELEPAATFDTNRYDNMLAEIQSRYDEQLKSYQSEVQAAQAAQEAKLAELTKQTEQRKKKIKKPRKFGRLSLLFGSELGIPEKKVLG